MMHRVSISFVIVCAQHTHTQCVDQKLIFTDYVIAFANANRSTSCVPILGLSKMHLVRFFLRALSTLSLSIYYLTLTIIFLSCALNLSAFVALRVQTDLNMQKKHPMPI